MYHTKHFYSVMYFTWPWPRTLIVFLYLYGSLFIPWRILAKFGSLRFLIPSQWPKGIFWYFNGPWSELWPFQITQQFPEKYYLRAFDCLPARLDTATGSWLRGGGQAVLPPHLRAHSAEYLPQRVAVGLSVGKVQTIKHFILPFVKLLAVT